MNFEQGYKFQFSLITIIVLIVLLIINIGLSYLIANKLGEERNIGFKKSLILGLLGGFHVGLICSLISRKNTKRPIYILNYILGFLFLVSGIYSMKFALDSDPVLFSVFYFALVRIAIGIHSFTV